MSRWLFWLTVGLLGGCASGRPAQFVPPAETPVPPQAAEAAPPSAPVWIEYGRPMPLLDGTGRLFGIPRQVLLWNRRVDNHSVSCKTEETAADYLYRNNMPDVLVRVNEYAPLAEWKRLANNRRISAGWRYTIGAFDLLLYTLMPGRLFGEDYYNPFTNTINLYSDVPAIALHEAAYAKDVQGRRYPGTYVVLQHVPLVGMWYRTNATLWTLQYLKQHGSPADVQEADRILYPMYGGAAGGQIGKVVPFPFVDFALAPVGAVVGHVVGRVRANQDAATEQEGQRQQGSQEGNQTGVPMPAPGH